MAGVLLIIKPGTVSFEWAVLLPLLSALAYAAMHTMTRQMGLAESAATMAVYIQFSFIASCLAMGIAFGDGRLAGAGHPALEFLFRAWAWPGPMDLALFLLAGVCSAVGGYLISQAYRSSAASLVAPFEYSSMFWAVLFGVLIWGDVPGPWTLAGAVVVIAAGL